MCGTDRFGLSILLILLPCSMLIAKEVLLSPVSQGYACTEEVRRNIKLTNLTITFLSSGKVVPYRNEKYMKWADTELKSAKSTPYDKPYCLPGGKKLAVFHLQRFYEYATVSASFYSLDGQKIGHIKTLYDNSYPSFSPDGEHLVINSSDPYMAPMIDGKIILYNIKGEELFNSGYFPEYFSKTFSMDMKSAYPLLLNLYAEDSLNFIFSHDSKYFAFPVIISYQLGSVPKYEAAGNVYIFVISIKGKLVKAIKEPASTKEELLHKLHSLLENK